jgi:predicted HD superfamily hydrolase involved in NAD metabolism
MQDSLTQLKELIQALPQGLQAHLARTRDLALELASSHTLPADKVELAALGHDLARAHRQEDLLREAGSLGLEINHVEKHVPLLLHGPIAATVLKQDCGVVDPEVLEAVRYHSTAIAGMKPVGLVVFLADKLEPQKVKRSKGLQGILATARHSLEHATVDYLTTMMINLLKSGKLLHPASIKARNDFLSRL